MNRPDADPKAKNRTLLDRGREIGHDALALVSTGAALGGLATAAEITLAADNTRDAEPVALETARSPESSVLAGMRDGRIPNLVWNGAGLFSEAELHTSPDNSDRTLAREVGDGEMMLAERLRLVQLNGKNGKKVLWGVISSTSRSTDRNQATDPKRNFWVNLSSTETIYKPFVYRNNNPDRSDGRAIDRTIKVGVDKRGNLSAAGVTGTIPHRRLAAAAFFPKSSAGAMLKRRGLVRSRSRMRYILPPETAQPIASPEGSSPLPGPSPKGEIVPKPNQPIPPTQPPPESVPGDPNSGPLEKLPGSRDVLTSQERTIYRESQVQFLRNGQNWIDGTLVSYQGKIGVVTCLHGITGDLIAQNPEKNYNPDGYFTNQITGPTNLISQIGPDVTYTVGSFEGQQVRAVSMIAMPRKDFLFLGLENQSAAAHLGKALPIETTNFGGERARPAADISAVGHSQISDYREIEGSEIYAGKINLSSYNGEDRDVYAVADNVEDYRTAPNGFGTSGRSVIVKNSDGTYSFLVGNSVRFFRNDRRGQLLPGDYPPGADWVESQLREKMPSVTFSGVTGYELYTSVTKPELVTLANIANR